MEYGFTAAAYVVAAVLFILSLGGLSDQESAKRAVWYGIVGMAIAIFATIAGPGVTVDATLVVTLAIGAVIGVIVDGHLVLDPRANETRDDQDD